MITIWMTLVLIPCGSGNCDDPVRERTVVFAAGTEGYNTFRIPALIEAADGSLLAFAEGRKDSARDTGDIDLVLRRSHDAGKTWSPLQVIWDNGPNTVGNPCPVLERESGTLFLWLTTNPGKSTEAKIKRGEGDRQAFLLTSSDHGATWSEPEDWTERVKLPTWGWYATGPGVGIQLRSGRLVIPCDHSVLEGNRYGSHVLISDDRGKNWRIGGVVGPDTNECQIAERDDGSLVLNMRNHAKDPSRANRRLISQSSDQGESWTEPEPHRDLIEPVCQASLIGRRTHDGVELLFSNPADTKRRLMTVRISSDGGTTWPRTIVIDPGPAAYSCLCSLPDGRVGLLWERGEKSPYDEIAFTTFEP